MSETIFLILTALCTFGFGAVWGYERQGPAWSAILSFVFLVGAAAFSAFAEARETTTAWQFCYNIIVFNGAVAGYTLGYPRKRWWWKRTLFGSLLSMIVCLIYLMVHL
jgi:hypothetical protein